MFSVNMCHRKRRLKNAQGPAKRVPQRLNVGVMCVAIVHVRSSSSILIRVADKRVSHSKREWVNVDATLCAREGTSSSRATFRTIWYTVRTTLHTRWCTVRATCARLEHPSCRDVYVTGYSSCHDVYEMGNPSCHSTHAIEHPSCHSAHVHAI